MRVIARRDLLSSFGAIAVGGAGLRILPARAAPDDHLRIGVSGFPPNLNPLMVDDLVARVLLSSMYEGLTTVDRRGGLLPALAVSWKARDDARIWRFHLRRNASFYNGAPFSAYDVKRSLDAAADTRNGVGFATRMVGRISGYQAKLKGEAPSLAGVEVIDDHTLDIHCDKPCATLPFFRINIVDLAPETAGDTRPYAGLPAGTGPYRIDGAMTGSHLSLTANERWWKGTPLYNQITLISINDKEHAATLFENGDIDFTVLDPDVVNRVADEPGFKRMLTSCERLQTRAIAFNSDRYPPFKDSRVRRALSMMIDRPALVERFYRGRAKVQNGVVPSALLDDSHLKPLTYNPAGARELLAAAGYPGGKGLEPVTLVVSLEYRREFAYYASQWSNLGVPTTVQALPRSEFVRHARNKEYQAFMLGWTASYPDPMNFLEEMFSSGSPFNHSGWSNDTFDATLKKAMTIADPQERTPVYRRAESLLMEDMPIIPLIVPDYVTLRSNIKADALITAFGGMSFC